MKTKGIRISDTKDGKCIPLSEILENIHNGMEFYWMLLWFNASPLKNQGRFLVELEKLVNQSENGFLVSFDFLNEVSLKIFQEIEINIVGDKKKENLHRYKEDQQMYETCDIVIEMIDGGFWEIFSKDIEWVEQLGKKFKNIEFLTSDFLK